MSGNDERLRRGLYIPEDRNGDFFDWSLNEGAPIKVECLDKANATQLEIPIDFPYWPWGCWGCENLGWEHVYFGRFGERAAMCGRNHPTFSYMGHRRNNSTAANRRYHTVYRTLGDGEYVR